MVELKGSDERLITYCRVGCHHSDRTKETFNNLCSSKFSNIKIIDVENNNASKKEVTDKIHKLFENSNDIQKNGVYEYNTFPRIIYISTSGNVYFIGGNDILQKILKGVKDIVKTKYKKDLSDADIVKLCVDEDKLNLQNNNEIRLAHFLIKKLQICK